MASALRRLFVQSSHYSIASLLSMVAGLVSFPLITRVFSVADYGAMNLVGATLTIAVAIGKFGVQHSILRYQSEIEAGKSPYTLAQLYSSSSLGMITIAFAVMLVIAAVTQFAPAGWIADPHVRGAFLIASPLIAVQVAESALTNVLRAEQNTAVLMKYQVLKKYLGLGLILVAVLWVSRSLTAFFSATVASEILALAMLAWFLFRDGKRPIPKPANFSRPLFISALGYGLPMMIGYELSGIILSVGDRYVIDGLIGDEPLGLYSAAYNLCQYVQSVVIVSVGQAIMPIYMRMWDQKGVEETSTFIARSLRSYVALGLPAIAGLWAVGPELLTSLASAKYAAAAGVIPWIVGGMVMDGANSMVGAGLFLHRKTRIIMAIVLSCAVLNLVLNLLFVPRIGIHGAAIATLISYSCTASALAIAGRHLLPVAMPWGTLARAGIASAIMYGTLLFVVPGRGMVTVGARIAVGGAIYATIMILIDGEMREVARRALAKLRRQRAGSAAA